MQAAPKTTIFDKIVRPSLYGLKYNNHFIPNP